MTTSTIKRFTSFKTIVPLASLMFLLLLGNESAAAAAADAVASGNTAPPLAKLNLANIVSAKLQQVHDADDPRSLMSMCEMMEDGLATEFADGELQPDCFCNDGGDSGSFSMGCTFDNTCGDGGMNEQQQQQQQQRSGNRDGTLCGSFRYEVTITGDLMAGNALIDAKSCFDSEYAWLDEVCMSMTYSSLELPTECSFTYDGRDCSCTVGTVEMMDGFEGIKVPCFQWDCSAVVPGPMVEYMQQDDCAMDVELTNATTSDTGMDSTLFFGSEIFPETMVEEMEAYEAARAADSPTTAGPTTLSPTTLSTASPTTASPNTSASPTTASATKGWAFFAAQVLFMVSVFLV